jgi:hypothetical protein
MQKKDADEREGTMTKKKRWRISEMERGDKVPFRVFFMRRYVKPSSWHLTHFSTVHVQSSALISELSNYTASQSRSTRDAVCSCALRSGHGIREPCVRCVVMTKPMSACALTCRAHGHCTPQTCHLFTLPTRACLHTLFVYCYIITLCDL